MILQPIQVILLTILIFAVSRVYLNAKQGVMPFGELIFWASIFITAIFGVIEPRFATYIAEKFGIGRGSDIVVYIALVVLFYLVFRLNVMLEDIRHEITKIVKIIALNDKEKEL